MYNSVGIILAFVALFSWGFGDFFIQKTTRLVGSFRALFFIGFVGFLALFPFVINDLPNLTTPDITLLVVLGIVVLFGALFDFEALRQGKIAIVEPIIGLELPMTVGLGLIFLGESLSIIQALLILTVFIGITLSVTTHHGHLRYHKRIFEKGVILAGIGAIGMALTNFMVGVSSSELTPLLAIWFAHTMLALSCGGYALFSGQFKGTMSIIRKHPVPIVGQSILDNLGWISYASATTYLPLSITTTISESYLALAVLLGIFINKEKLKSYQLIGVLLATLGVISLSFFS